MGANEAYAQVARQVGATLAKRGIRVVYGGARVGLMGIVADSALEQGGEVIGVIPGFLQTKEVGHSGLTELIIVDTMHERKLKMFDLCDGILTIPGGWGTMEEMFEMLSWGLLGLHGKPVGLLNVNGYYDALISMSETMVNEGFLQQSAYEMLLADTSFDDLLDKMEAYTPPQRPRYITEETT
jgi:uncharacterized protein (TIGR00730 family)